MPSARLTMATMVRPPEPFSRRSMPSTPMAMSIAPASCCGAGTELGGADTEDLGTIFDDLVDAMVAVTWWRGLHARPLPRSCQPRSRVAAEGGQVDGRVDAPSAQAPTEDLQKLEREPTMQLTQMQDIGGVRARLPSLTHVYAVSRRLRKTWTIIRQGHERTRVPPVTGRSTTSIRSAVVWSRSGSISQDAARPASRGRIRRRSSSPSTSSWASRR